MITSRPPNNHRRSEDIAAEFLQTKGLVLQMTNYRNRTGDIGLIMIDDQTLVFVEIKEHRDSWAGRPKKSVGIAKQAKLRRAATSHYNATTNRNPGDTVAIMGSPQA